MDQVQDKFGTGIPTAGGAGVGLFGQAEFVADAGRQELFGFGYADLEAKRAERKAARAAAPSGDDLSIYQDDRGQVFLPLNYAKKI